MKKTLAVLLLALPMSFSCESSDISSAAGINTISAFSDNNCESVNYLTGSPEDIKTQTESGLVLMGGGKDVDDAFRWMIKKSGGGDFVILRTSGADGYNDYVYSKLGGVNSVETLMVDSREKANCPSVAEKIRNAEAVFISGGDQSTYYTFWKGTETQKALEYLNNVKKVPIGGTSAGLAILGEVIYSAETGSVTSPTAMANPYAQSITLKKDFLSFPVMKNIITDTHFAQRDRQGRIITFLARSATDGLVDRADAIKGIAVDESTAFVLQEDGTGKVLGNNNAWFFRAENGAPEACVANQPLNWNRNKHAVKTYVLKGNAQGTNSFNIKKWSPISGTPSLINYYVENGTLKQN